MADESEANSISNESLCKQNVILWEGMRELTALPRGKTGINKWREEAA
jgi:hypothetical protein